MKKLLDILLVHRTEVENKWWHRLANVVIYGSTAIILLLAGIFIFSDSDSWKTYKYTAYNFELKYSKALGQEIGCSFQANDYISPTIDCGDIRDSKDLIMRIANRYASSTIEDMLNTDLKNPDKTPFLKDDFKIKLESLFTPEQLKMASWDDVVNAGIKTGLFNDIKVKKQNIILYRNLGKDILYAILAVLGWFIFWESIIYRVLLYIIYGKRREEKNN